MYNANYDNLVSEGQQGSCFFMGLCFFKCVKLVIKYEQGMMVRQIIQGKEVYVQTISNIMLSGKMLNFVIIVEVCHIIMFMIISV